MGLHNGAYAYIFETKPVSETKTNGRISISRKDKRTGEYVYDFTGFVDFIGSECAKNACNLKEGDKIKISSVDVSNFYNKETGKQSWFCKIFGFEMADAVQKNPDAAADDTKQEKAKVEDKTEPQPEVDNGEVELKDSELPF